jgi:DNA-binding SARP family transcriptional activator
VVEVRLFGVIEVRVNCRRLGPRDFGGVKPKQLLEALLVQRGRALAKDQLAEMIWGEALPRKVAATIESYVSLLRSRLGAASALIATETGGYRAELRGVQVDVDAFDGLLRDAGDRDRRAARGRAACRVGDGPSPDVRRTASAGDQRPGRDLPRAP